MKQKVQTTEPSSLPLSFDFQMPQPGQQQLIMRVNSNISEPVHLSEIVFSFRHAVELDSFKGVEFVSRTGDIFAASCAKTLQPGSEFEFSFRTQLPASWRWSDAPGGLYAVDDLGGCLRAEKRGPKCVYEFEPKAKLSNLALVPKPRKLSKGTLKIPAPATINLEGFEDWEMRWLERLAAKFEVPLSFSPSGFEVRFHTSSSQDTRGYALDLHAAGLNLSSNADCRPAARATLAQILLQWPQLRGLEELKIRDEPGFEYRGLMLDVARHFHPFSDLQHWTDMALLLKFNHLQLHLSDDEGWRIELEQFPELHSRGGMRGHGQRIPAHFDANPATCMGYYRNTDVRRISKEARALGLSLVPEIDVPGHARALLKAMPGWREELDASTYESVQFFSDNVLSPTFSNVLENLKKIFSEVGQMFAADLVHLGGDEVPEGAWQKSPSARKALADLGKSEPSELAVWFTQEIALHLREEGRVLGFWDDAVDVMAHSPDALAFVWQDEHLQKVNEAAAHPVVLCLARACYFDHPLTEDQSDPGLTWAQKNLNFEQVSSWDPFEQWSADSADDRVVGVQANLWSELTATRKQAEFMLFPRLLAFAQLAWNGRGPEKQKLSEDEAQAFAGWLAQAGVGTRARGLGW